MTASAPATRRSRCMSSASRPRGPTGKAMWVLEGGPGYSSAGLETFMKDLYDELKEEVSIYTMDHRGVARSSGDLLVCDNANAVAQGSPRGLSSDFSNLPACIENVRAKIEDKPVAFSTTSAARDLVHLIDLFNKNERVTVYGCSYGSYLAQRVIHLKPPQVFGYVVDGIVSEEKTSFATMASDAIPTNKYFAELCESDKQCMALYDINDSKNNGGLLKAWRDLYDRLDRAHPGSNPCADYVRGNGPLPPSEVLRMAFNLPRQYFYGVTDVEGREFVPAIMKRLHTCAQKDLDEIKRMYSAPNNLEENVRGFVMNNVRNQFDLFAGNAPILAGLIKASEMWKTDSMTATPWLTEKQKTLESVFSYLNREEYSWYCILNGDLKDPACDALRELGTIENVDYSRLALKKFTYQPDQYFRKVANLPTYGPQDTDGVSMLYVQGKLDFQTGWNNAESVWMKRVGGVTQLWAGFDLGPHSPGIFPLGRGDTSKCGVQVIASFVRGTKAQYFNTACMKLAPPLNFNVEPLIT
ncbi:hypothetical protein PINS_up021215 [Pythium insidiosum]|nr:hypothetical protein PINS_up021215 [Pythium insidiosum]